MTEMINEGEESHNRMHECRDQPIEEHLPVHCDETAGGLQQ